MRSGRLPIAIIIAAVALSACGDTKKPPTVKVGVIAPLSGALGAVGLGIRNGVNLAVRQANGQQKVKGWKIVVVAEDDAAVPDVGANAATRLADDDSVLAVIGPLNSTVAQKAVPIANSRKLVMISPANTDPTLTRRPSPDQDSPMTEVRPFEYYFRVAPSDLVQGPFAANFAYRSAGKRNVAVLHDKTTYGQDLALGFKAQFEALGGKVPAVETVDAQEKDFSVVLSAIKRLNPDMIYFGGEYPAGALLTSQADQHGIPAPLMGGYGIWDPAYIATARGPAEGDLATSVVASTDQLPAAAAFVKAYRAAGYADPDEAYGASAYDAANVLVAAMAKVLPAKGRITGELRARLRQAVQDGAIDGVTGKVAFDQFGDRTARILTVYQVERDAAGALTWKPRETKEFP